ncbi:PD-(D/E)XK nuclease-like domain-containing protein [Streptomyces sp. NPDC058947]|uniref:PD-(D/E)XK nuclease-like domain-containing protein n=1 Tax=Streptomyces sp. NPDC058947 TaxID=3346675 RepID=UPI0036CA12CA
MTTIVETPVVTEPGIYPDMPIDVYHADPVPGGSLSSSGARKLLDPGCPAQFKYDRDHPQPHKREFDLGHAAHLLVLGEGPELEVIDFPDWKKVAARELRDLAYDEGKVPLLTKDHEQVQAMAEAIRQHPTAGALFAPGNGIAEQSLFWQDPRHGVWRRARPDWMPHRHEDGRLVVVDYKTARAVDPAALQRSVYEHGYHAQAAWYLDAVKAVDLAGGIEPAFVFVFQAKTAPYLVHLVELDFPALTLGAARNDRALRIYAECERTGHWPGFNDRITYLPLPAWAEKRDHEEYA